MKKYIPVALLLAVVASALAIPIYDFKGWNDLITESPEIFVARCVSTFDFISATNRRPTIVIDGITHSEVEVISVLKGQHEMGLSRLNSGYWPYRGEYFLVFTNEKKDQYNLGYTAIEEYRIIPLGHNFMTNRLAGKTLDEQVNLILSQRLSDLNGELESDNAEKNRLEERLKGDVKESQVPTNAPPPRPQSSSGF